MKNLLKYGTMVMAVVFVLISCDTDPNELGGEFLGIDIDGTIVEQDFEAKAFSAPLNAVQTNRFPSVQLGTYSDRSYGVTKYGFVSQVALANTTANYGTNRSLDSVIISLPYFSTIVNQTGEITEYELDSVYGNGRVDVKMYENKYFLSSFDPNNIEQSAVYFSDFGDVIDNNRGVLIHTIGSFNPSNKEIALSVTDPVTNEIQVQNRLPPTLRLKLSKDFWQQKIIDQLGTSNLANNSNFQNYFRGLYLTVENPINGGVLTTLNLAEANVEMFITSDFEDTNDLDNDGDRMELITINSTLRLNFTGTRAVLIESSIPAATQTAITNSFNPATGSERLYLKGGPGAMTFIDLFGPDNDNNGEADALTELKSKNVLVNEANLEFYVDESSVEEGDSEPERILIYDFVTGNLLADFEISQNGASQNFSHLGRLETDSDGNRKYKIRLTNHIARILEDRIDNNRLALVVSQNVTLLGFSKVENQTQPISVMEIPTSAAISHEGTVLYGNLSRNDDDPSKRLKLKIFFTETN